MTSTFFGFETARRAMAAHQSALFTTGQNIANANTKGYTRQRVSFVQSEPYPAVGKNRPNIPGQVGTGVSADLVERVRNRYLDIQFRAENNKTGFYEAKANSLGKIEEIMNEPSEQGLAKTLENFWQSLQDLSTNPNNEGARAVVKERGNALADTFSYLSRSLEANQQDTKQEIIIDVNQINSIATQINALNNQIMQIEVNGYIPNDLYDQRDLLLDDLSKYVDFTTSQVPSGGLSSPNAEGKVTVNINGLGTLIDGTNATVPPLLFNVQFDGINGSVNTISLGSNSTTVHAWSGRGEFRGLIDSFGYQDSNGLEVGDFPDMLRELDNLAFTYADGFNTVHRAGLGLNEILSGTDLPINFFEPDTTLLGTRAGYAKSIKVSSAILSDLDNIAAAVNTGTGNSGDGKNAINLAKVKDTPLLYNPLSTGDSFQNYYSSVIASMALETQETIRHANNSNVLREAVSARKDSVSAVSLDEEMANMVKFQHAYNAAARHLTTMDEILDKVINGLGHVGR